MELEQTRAISRIWMSGDEKCCVVKVCKVSTGDFMFESMTLDHIQYRLVNAGGFRQWIYLVCPEAFQMALNGTCWQDKHVQFMLKSNAVVSGLELRWSITVNYLFCTCCAVGIRIKQMDFVLELSG